MDITYTKKKREYSRTNIDSAEQSDESLNIMTGEETEVIEDSSLSSVRSANTVCIRRYYGDQVSEIEKANIVTFTPDILRIKCTSAQQIGNRIIIQFEDNSVEFSGELYSARSNKVN